MAPLAKNPCMTLWASKHGQYDHNPQLHWRTKPVARHSPTANLYRARAAALSNIPTTTGGGEKR